MNHIRVCVLSVGNRCSNAGFPEGGPGHHALPDAQPAAPV